MVGDHPGVRGIAAGGPYFNYYAAFFFGFTEISSMPLAFVDLFRQLPKLADANPAQRTSLEV